MNRLHRVRPVLRPAALAAAVLLAAGCGSSGGGSGGGIPTREIPGPTAPVAGTPSSVRTYAIVDNTDSVLEAGVRVPFAVIETPPPTPGPGNAGAVATVSFPVEVQNTTLLHHFELHYEPAGHPPAGVYDKPHYDLHAYAIAPAAVAAIAGNDTAVPVAARVPAGYTYPGVNQAVPQMGVHAAPNSDFAPGFVFRETMILGYWGGSLISVEPMITRDRIMTKSTITLTIAEPAELGRATRYPTRFLATYDAASDTYTFAFSNFVSKPG